MLIWNSNSSFKVVIGFFAALSLCTGAVAAPLPLGKVIESVEIECVDPDLRALAESFFPEFLGKQLSMEKVSEGIKQFYFRQPISAIRIYSETGKVGVRLRVDIQVTPVIEAVDFKGNHSIDESKLRPLLETKVSDYAFRAHMDRSAETLQAYYHFRGFPFADVRIRTEGVDDPKKARLVVEIREGEACRIDSVQVESDSSVLTADEIRDLVDLKQGELCDGETAAKGARRIESKLREEGYLSASVQDPEVRYSEDLLRAHVFLKIATGPKIRVRFLGNTFLFERNSMLEKAIDLEGEKQFSDAWIESGAKYGIREFYRARGYAKSTIDVQDEVDRDQNLRNITFRVSRGARFHLRKVEFAGNVSMESGELRKQFWLSAPEHTRKRTYVKAELEEMATALVGYYQAKGFLRAEVKNVVVKEDPEARRADVTYILGENERSTLSHYQMHGNQYLDNRSIENFMEVESGDPVDLVVLNRAAERIEDHYRKAGYKFVDVRLPRLEEVPEGAVELQIDIHEGPTVHFGEISIRGNLHTKDRVVRRELTFREGDVYNPEKLRSSRRNLLRLGFFDRVVIEELDFNPETGRERVVVTVHEKKKRSVRLRPGFSTDDGVRGALELAYINIAGTGRSASASGRVSRQVRNADIIEHRAVFSYREPKILNLVDGKFHFIDERSEEQQFDLDRRSIILGVEREILSWIRTSLQWELEFREPFNEEPGAILSPIDDSSARFGSVATLIDFDRRDDVLNPRTGSFHRIEFRAFQNTFLSDADFFKVYTRNTFFFPIYKRIKIVFSVRAGFSATFGQTSDAGIEQIPIEKRFRLGGNTSLRGFNRNCIGGLGSGIPENCADEVLEQAPGGNAVFNYMMDLIFPLFDGFDFAIFTDGGNAYLSNGEFDIFDIRTTAGAGLRYNSFFGPLRLDYGIVLDRRTGENFGEIHFAVGYF